MEAMSKTCRAGTLLQWDGGKKRRKGRGSEADVSDGTEKASFDWWPTPSQKFKGQIAKSWFATALAQQNESYLLKLTCVA